MKAALAGAVALVALSSGAAAAFQVAHGCDEPGASGHGRTFFVDPARGSAENDGSEAKPWRTLAEVLNPARHLVATRAYTRTAAGLGPPEPINPAGPVKPGDTIVLMSGDHGSVEIKQYVNRNFIYVVAGEGQTPVVKSLRISNSSHWLFNGIKFQGVRPQDDLYGPMVAIGMSDYWGPTDNIVFSDNSVSTEDHTEGWTPQDWVTKPYKAGLVSMARCTTLLHNHFFNLRDAVGIGKNAEHSLIENNVIEDMGNDGIDITASDLVVRGNRIGSSRHTPAEPLHPDGIQGWSVNGATNRNVVIDANRVINLNPAEDNAMQGISIFSGKWDGLAVTNNVVVTNTWHGIALYGVSNAVVANNTVAPARPDRFATWLLIHDLKEGAPSENVLVLNNIAAQVIASGDNLVVDHNIASKRIDIKLGNRDLEATTGRVGDHNIIDPYIYSQFEDFDPHRGRLELRPSARSPAAGAGEAAGAPTFDVEGRRRVAPIDIGAYAR